MSIPAVVLLGVFYSSDCESDSTLDCLTVANARDDKMFLVFFAVFCYSLLGYFFVYLYA